MDPCCAQLHALPLLFRVIRGCLHTTNKQASSTGPAALCSGLVCEACTVASEVHAHDKQASSTWLLCEALRVKSRAMLSGVVVVRSRLRGTAGRRLSPTCWECSALRVPKGTCIEVLPVRDVLSAGWGGCPGCRFRLSSRVLVRGQKVSGLWCQLHHRMHAPHSSFPAVALG